MKATSQHPFRRNPERGGRLSIPLEKPPLVGILTQRRGVLTTSYPQPDIWFPANYENSTNGFLSSLESKHETRTQLANIDIKTLCTCIYTALLPRTAWKISMGGH